MKNEMRLTAKAEAELFDTLSKSDACEKAGHDWRTRYCKDKNGKRWRYQKCYALCGSSRFTMKAALMGFLRSL